jgi:hypothetical protein
MAETLDMSACAVQVGGMVNWIAPLFLSDEDEAAGWRRGDARAETFTHRCGFTGCLNWRALALGGSCQCQVVLGARGPGALAHAT